MELTKKFRNLRFPEAIVRQAIAAGTAFRMDNANGSFEYLRVSIGSNEWVLDESEDFFSEFANADIASFHYRVQISKDWYCGFSYYADQFGTTVSAWGQHRHQVNSIMNIFQQGTDQASPIKAAEQPISEGEDASIFIGHGRSKAWEELRNHLQDKHNHKVVAFESGARAGHHVRDILEEMMDRSSLAFLVLTGEDETADEQMRARQNVIHEVGLFQGRLGFSRAIVLLEEGVENLSNLAGIQYIPFTKGHINGTFGEVLAIIKRELFRPRARTR